jgi:divalent metal cation (Fe/Co/Zn/Cd) transporter
MTTESTGRAAAIRAGIRAEIVTIVWMILEAALAIFAGVRARSVLVTAFGIDSVIELLSASVLLWRIRNESSPRAEAIERRAAAISAVLLVLLCLYIVASAGIGIAQKIDPEQSVLGLVVSASAVLLMPLLARWKRRVNVELQSAALRADIAETSACGYMAAIVVIGVLLNRFLNIWWIERTSSRSSRGAPAHPRPRSFEGAPRCS